MPEFGGAPPDGATIDCERVGAELLADQYVLGQLAAPEVEAFEDHYMTCASCAEEVENAELTAKGFRRLAADRLAGAVEIDAGSMTPGAAAPEAPAPATVTPIREFKARRSGGLGRIAGLLAAAFAGAILTLPLWLGQGPSPGDGSAAVSVFHIQPERSVDAAPSRRVAAPGDSEKVVLALELTGPFYDSYAVTLERQARNIWDADGLHLGERDTLHLQLPPGLLSPGDYTLIADGHDGAGAGIAEEVGRFAFRVE